jgi:hypothetical protein
MNDISLIQGKKFKKLNEGFTNKNTNANTNTNTNADLEELKDMQSKYDSLLNEYNNIKSKINNKELEIINRVSANNPYLGKNVKFNNGMIGYVTEQGILKPYENYDIYKNTAGINGCPTGFTSIDIPWNNYIQGDNIPTNPSLLVGSNMRQGESCGYEGSNVYVSKLVSQPNSSYIGCFKNISDNTNSSDNTSVNAMIPGPINTTFEKCQDYALNNGYNYFGLQNYQSDGTFNCVLSNDINNIQMYGSATELTNPIPIWASNTNPNTNIIAAYINPEGNLTLNDNEGNVIWSSPNAPIDCISGGYVNEKTIQGSWGGNCVGKPLNIDCGNPSATESYDTSKLIGNLNELLQQQAKSKKNIEMSWSYNPILNWDKEDPAQCCEKLVDYSYQCGGSSFKTGQISGGSNILFDCSNEVANCSFYLLLQNDGNMCLYRGTDPSNNKGLIWATNTNGKQQSPNINWISKNGKYGRNYLKLNEYLGTNDWISSDDGSLKLIMQPDGNLVLYTSTVSKGCITANKKTYGSANINAVYKLDNIGDKNVLGKLANINPNAELIAYPDSMIGYSNSYDVFDKMDNIGNDINSVVLNTPDECENTCSNTKECSGYVYQNNSKTCWLKNAPLTDLHLNKVENDSTVLGIRRPAINIDGASCNKQINDIDSVRYNNYTSTNTNTSICNKNLSAEDEQKYNNIINQLEIYGENIINKMNELYKKDDKINEKMNINVSQFNEKLERYKEINSQLKNKSFNFNFNFKEGFNNNNSFTSFKSIFDINGLLKETSLSVLQGNYIYILWIILGISLLIITINLMSSV